MEQGGKGIHILEQEGRTYIFYSLALQCRQVPSGFPSNSKGVIKFLLHSVISLIVMYIWKKGKCYA